MKLKHLLVILACLVINFLCITVAWQFFPSISMSNGSTIDLAPIYIALAFASGIFLSQYLNEGLYKYILDSKHSSQNPFAKVNSEKTSTFKEVSQLTQKNKAKDNFNENNYHKNNKKDESQNILQKYNGRKKSNNLLKKNQTANVNDNPDLLAKNTTTETSIAKADLDLIVAEGYYELEMYPEAWVAACKSASSKKNLAESVSLQLKICISTKRWKLGEQIAREYIYKNGYAPFLAEFFVSYARVCSDKNDYQLAKENLSSANKCVSSEIIEHMIQEPKLKKIFFNYIK